MLVRLVLEAAVEVVAVLAVRQVRVQAVLVLQIHYLVLLLPILLVVEQQYRQETQQELLIAEMAVVM
jgi:hypothetical protein